MEEIHWRPGQKEVMDYRKGRMAVSSVPGAGKTTLLSALCAELVAEGRQHPGKVLVVTYTNSAVSAFRTRITEFLQAKGLPGGKGWEARTLHSLAHCIVREDPGSVLVSDEFQVIGEAHRRRAMYSAVDRVLHENRQNFYAFIRHGERGGWSNRKTTEERWRDDFTQVCGQAVSLLKSKGIERDAAFELHNRSAQSSLVRWVIRVYLEYQKELEWRGWLDYDDLTLKALELVHTHSSVLSELRDRYRFVFEDESQDTTPRQEELLECISGVEGNLVRVGDPNQSILATFTSSDPGLFDDFRRRKTVDTCHILHSGRSAVPIIELANHLVGWSAQHHPLLGPDEGLREQYIHPVPAGDPSPNPLPEGRVVTAFRCETDEEEREEVMRRITLLSAENFDYSVAVAVRTNWEVRSYVEHLRRGGLSCFELTGVSASGEKTLRVVGHILAFLARPCRQDFFLRAMETWVPDIMENAAFCERLQGITLEELFSPLTGGGVSDLFPVLEQEGMEKGFREGIEKIGFLLKAFSQNVEKLVLLVGETVGAKAEELSLVQGVAEEARRILDEDPAGGLSRTATELLKPRSRDNRFRALLSNLPAYIPRAGEVAVTTLHKAKGLEWDAVFLPGLTAENFPARPEDPCKGETWFLKDDIKNPMWTLRRELAVLWEGKEEMGEDVLHRETVAEALRLLYVGITRARRRLVISTYRRPAKNKKAGKNSHACVYFEVLESCIREREGTALS